MDHKTEDVRAAVRDAYARVAETRGGDGAGTGSGGCCGGGSVTTATTVCCGTAEPIDIHAERLGYTAEDAAGLGNLGVGCGNPTAIAALRPGEVVVDLGSGGGFDCFLAARQVGPEGRVIGVDMTPEMVATARRNRAASGLETVEFRLGEIEALPIADGTADVILSNCVINLSPDKARVFTEAFRVLKPGGRLVLSDVVALKPLPETLREDLHLVSCCIGGAALIDDLLAFLRQSGFVDARVTVDPGSRDVIADWAPGSGAEAFVASASIEARKPA